MAGETFLQLINPIWGYIFSICLIGVSIYAIILLIKLRFLIFEKKFDKEYFEKRKNLGYDSKFCSGPFKYAEMRKLTEMSSFKNESIRSDWKPDLINSEIVDISLYNNFPGLYDFIYEIYDELKNSNSHFHKKLFEPNSIKTTLFRNQEKHSLESMVENILYEVPSKEYVIVQELIRICVLVNEKIISEISKDKKKFEELLKIYEERLELKNGEGEMAVKDYILPLSGINHINLYLEGMCNAFDIRINAYDARNSIPDYHNDFIIGPENPLKEYTVIILDEGIFFVK